MDPTEGLLSIFIMGFINYIRQISSASHSRQNEKEADELGIQLAAMSCFDTKRAAKVMAKMHQNEIELETEQKTMVKNINNDDKRGGGYALSSFLDSHPPSMLRYETLLELSKVENSDKYHSQCSDTRSKFLRALKLL